MTNPINEKSKALPCVLLLGVAAISFAAVFFKKAEPTHPLVSAGIRLSAAALMLAPFLLNSILRRKISKRFLRHAFLAGLFYAVHFGAWVTSLTLTSIAASVTLVTTTPLLLGIAAMISGRDRPDRWWWFSLVLAAGGLALISGGDIFNRVALAGNGLALLGACAMASYLLSARSLGEELDVPAFSAIATTTGASVLLGTAAISGIPIRPASGEAFLYLLLAALIPQLVGHTAITWALHRTSPALSGIAILGEPVGAAIIGWLWLGQNIPFGVGAGCALTIAAVALAVLKRADEERPANATVQ